MTTPVMALHAPHHRSDGYMPQVTLRDDHGNPASHTREPLPLMPVARPVRPWHLVPASSLARLLLLAAALATWSVVGAELVLAAP